MPNSADHSELGGKSIGSQVSTQLLVPASAAKEQLNAMRPASIASKETHLLRKMVDVLLGDSVAASTLMPPSSGFRFLLMVILFVASLSAGSMGRVSCPPAPNGTAAAAETPTKSVTDGLT